MIKKVVLMFSFLAAMGCISEAAHSSKSMASFYVAVQPFDPGADALCFANGALQTGEHVLIPMFNEFGACNGMANVVRAFKQYVTFKCDGRRPNETELTIMIRNAIARNRSNCALQDKIEIKGYCSLKELCRKNQALLEHEVIRHHMSVAQDVLPNIGLLLAGKTDEAQVRNMRVFSGIYEELIRGRYPLLLYPSHVVTVTGMEIMRTGSGYQVVLRIADPNYPSGHMRETYEVDHDFKRTVGEPPLFIASPMPLGENYPWEESRACRKRSSKSDSPI